MSQQNPPMNVPDAGLSKLDTENRRTEHIVSLAADEAITGREAREMRMRGSSPAPPPATHSDEGDAFFTFGNPLGTPGNGSALAPVDTE